MNWARFGLALVAAGFAISLSDWFFFGVLFHGKYLETPEVWRTTSENRKIAWSLLLAVVGTVAFFALCNQFGVSGFSMAFRAAALVWVIAPLPLTITNTLFIKHNPLLAVSHSLGWFAARLLIAAGAYAWLLG